MTLDFDEFDDLYPDKLTEAQFDSYAPSAAAYLGVITHNRCDTADGWKLQRAKLAAFAVVNALFEQDAAKSENGARLASVSNDGYSETYIHSATDDGEAVRRAAANWLSGTGLVSAL